VADHDQAYKLLFSHPQMVRDLLEGFVRDDWISELDFSSLEKVSSRYVSDDLRKRSNDVVWRVRWGTEWVYVYLLLEFQSGVERYMAVRIQNYVSLLYQDLIRTKQLGAGGKLPPVLPIVLYNGARRWRSPVVLDELIQRGPRALAPYQPQMRYLLIDEGLYLESELETLRNLVAALVRLENSRTPVDVLRIVSSLAEWLKAPEQASLRRAFVVWINRVILARKPGGPVVGVEELEVMSTLLEVRMREWDEASREKGREEGLQEGLREGEALLLHRLLRQRFGELPDWVWPRLQQADTAQLDQWGERVLSADSLGAVFGEE
jgi:predicted transposase YdaD